MRFLYQHRDVLVVDLRFGIWRSILWLIIFSPRDQFVKLPQFSFGVSRRYFLRVISWFETSQVSYIWMRRFPFLYGILSCGGAYSFQVVAQKDTEPTVASLCFPWNRCLPDCSMLILRTS